MTNETLDFDTWMTYVDYELEEKFQGLGHADLIDWHWLDAYEDGLKPEEAVCDFMDDNWLDLGL